MIFLRSPKMVALSVVLLAAYWWTCETPALVSFRKRILFASYLFPCLDRQREWWQRKKWWLAKLKRPSTTDRSDYGVSKLRNGSLANFANQIVYRTCQHIFLTVFYYDCQGHFSSSDPVSCEAKLLYVALPPAWLEFCHSWNETFLCFHIFS